MKQKKLNFIDKFCYLVFGQVPKNKPIAEYRKQLSKSDEHNRWGVLLSRSIIKVKLGGKEIEGNNYSPSTYTQKQIRSFFKL